MSELQRLVEDWRKQAEDANAKNRHHEEALHYLAAELDREKKTAEQELRAARAERDVAEAFAELQSTKLDRAILERDLAVEERDELGRACSQKQTWLDEAEQLRLEAVAQLQASRAGHRDAERREQTAKDELHKARQSAAAQIHEVCEQLRQAEHDRDNARAEADYLKKQRDAGKDPRKTPDVEAKLAQRTKALRACQQRVRRLEARSAETEKLLTENLDKAHANYHDARRAAENWRKEASKWIARAKAYEETAKQLETDSDGWKDKAVEWMRAAKQAQSEVQELNQLHDERNPAP